MACFSCFIKFLMSTVNVLIILIGVLYIGLASFMWSTATTSMLYFMYSLGGIFFIVALIGCFGSMKENICMITMYAAIVLVLIVLQIVGNIFVMDSAKVQELAETEVHNKWLKEQLSAGAMDEIQQTYECCGRIAARDYIQITKLFFPKSCYKNSNFDDPKSLFGIGCTAVMRTYFLNIFNRVHKANWIFVGMTIICFMITIYVIMHLKDNKRREGNIVLK